MGFHILLWTTFNYKRMFITQHTIVATASCQGDTNMAASNHTCQLIHRPAVEKKDQGPYVWQWGNMTVWYSLTTEKLTIDVCGSVSTELETGYLKWPQLLSQWSLRHVIQFLLQFQESKEALVKSVTDWTVKSLAPTTVMATLIVLHDRRQIRLWSSCMEESWTRRSAPQCTYSGAEAVPTQLGVGDKDHFSYWKGRVDRPHVACRELCAELVYGYMCVAMCIHVWMCVLVHV